LTTRSLPGTWRRIFSIALFSITRPHGATTTHQTKLSPPSDTISMWIAYHEGLIAIATFLFIHLATSVKVFSPECNSTFLRDADSCQSGSPTILFPTINLEEFQNASLPRKIEIADALDRAMTTTGFFYLEGHGVDSETIKTLREATARFHDRDISYKQGYRAKVYATEGYNPYGLELQRRTQQDHESVEGTTSHEIDLKDMNEWFKYVAYEGDELELKESNLPKEFRNAIQAYMCAMQALTTDLHQLASFALHLTDPHVRRNLTDGAASPEKYLNDNIIEAHFHSIDDEQHHVREGQVAAETDLRSFISLRLTNYFSLSDADAASGAYRIGEHDDYLGFTILSAGSVNGLQAHASGKWHDLRTHPDTFIINAGLIISHMTNGHWKAAKHRVAAVSTERRISTPAFTAPGLGKIISPFKRCAACNAEPFKFPRISVAEHYSEMKSAAFTY